MSVGVRVTSPAPRTVWRELLAACPEAVVSQTPAWLDCICAAEAYDDASRLYELPDGHRLLLPSVRRRHCPAALATEEALPAGWGIGGPLTDGRLRVEDAAAIFSDLAHRPAVRTSIRPNPLDGAIWATARPAEAVVVPRLAHVLDLDGGFVKVWEKRFSSQARNHGRQAERAGLVVECDTTGALLPVFQTLLEQSTDRWADQQHEPRWLARWRRRRSDPLRRFQAIATRIGDACRFWVAWHAGRPAAGIIVLQGANAHDTFGVMDKEVAAPTHANYLLHKLAIEEACRSGCRRYHMGESGGSESLARFKSQLGARPYPWAEYHFERLPLTRADARLRGAVKWAIRFKDTPT